jgi:hypothetical protein
VPRGGKFLTLYKRNGHRVIVNRAGGCGPPRVRVPPPGRRPLARPLQPEKLPNAVRHPSCPPPYRLEVVGFGGPKLQSPLFFKLDVVRSSVSRRGPRNVIPLPKNPPHQATAAADALSTGPLTPRQLPAPSLPARAPADTPTPSTFGPPPPPWLALLGAAPPPAGDLVVRPTPFESSLIQTPLGSNPLHHLLSGYRAALTAVRADRLALAGTRVRLWVHADLFS